MGQHRHSIMPLQLSFNNFVDGPAPLVLVTLETGQVGRAESNPLCERGVGSHLTRRVLLSESGGQQNNSHRWLLFYSPLLYLAIPCELSDRPYPSCIRDWTRRGLPAQSVADTTSSSTKVPSRLALKLGWQCYVLYSTFNLSARYPYIIIEWRCLAEMLKGRPGARASRPGWDVCTVGSICGRPGRMPLQAKWPSRIGTRRLPSRSPALHAYKRPTPACSQTRAAILRTI